jgi:hypothetical protein
MWFQRSRQGQDSPRLTTCGRPIRQIAILLKFAQISQPDFTGGTIDLGDVGNVARAYAAANREMDIFEQPSDSPLFLEPFHGNLRMAFVQVPTAATHAHRDVGDDFTLRGDGSRLRHAIDNSKSISIMGDRSLVRIPTGQQSGRVQDERQLRRDVDRDGEKRA